MAMRKNRSEKGSRDELLGSNPHSKGEFFSRSEVSFFESKEAKPITSVARVTKMIAMVTIRYNIYSEMSDLLVGSQVYSYTK
jgi:hypothetical protein